MMTGGAPVSLSTRELLILYFAALLVRVMNLMFITDIDASRFIEDSPIYWNGAKDWIESGFFSRRFETGYLAETERVPLYFLFIIPFRFIFGDVVLPLLSAQAALDAGTCMIIALLGGMLRRNIGLLAGGLAAAWPNLIIHSSLVLSDTLFLFLFSVMLLNAAQFLTRANIASAALAGLFCGLAVMTRPVALFLIPAIVVAAPFIAYFQRRHWGVGITFAGVFLALALAPATPLVVRNYKSFDTFQLTSQSGTHFLAWIVGTTQSIASQRPFDKVSNELNQKLFARLPEGKNLTPFESSHFRMELARSEIVEMPISAFLHSWSVGSTLNLTAPAVLVDPRVRNLKTNSFANTAGDGLVEKLTNFLKAADGRYTFWAVIGLIGAGVTVLLQIAGLGFVFQAFLWPAVFASLGLSYFLLANGPIGSPKYRLPVEPILIVLQAAAMIRVYQYLRSRRSKKVLYRVPDE